jgi:hypothetical protein
MTGCLSLRDSHQISSPGWGQTLPAVDRIGNPQIVFA